MDTLPDAFPPVPISSYGDQERPLIFSREDKMKYGQLWDIFEAWGKLSLQAVTTKESSKMTLKYKATSTTLPVLPANNISKDFLDPCLEPLEERREMIRMKEGIAIRIARAKGSHINYDVKLKTLKKQAEKILDEAKSLVSEHTSGKACPTTSDADQSISEADFESDVTDDVVSMAEQFTTPDSLASQLLCDFHKDSRLFGETNIAMVPDQYFGGCLKTINHLDEDLVLHTSGSKMCCISVRKVRCDGNKLDVLQSFDRGFTNRVYQLELSSYSDELLAAARFKKKTCIFDVRSNKLKLLSSVNSTLSSISFNPYYPEALYCEDGDLYIWNDFSDAQLVLANWKPAFDVAHDFRTTYYGSHPRNLILTDPSSCFLFDARTKSSQLELFDVPSNRLLQSKERLVMSAKSGDFSHHILAQHTLLTVDERHTKYPLFYQVLPCLAWPLFLSNKRVTPQTELILIGCPTNREVFCCVMDSSCGLVKTTPVWKCSQLDDILHFGETLPLPSQMETMKTRLNTGILGVASTCVSERGFSIMMLSGKGDLFEQTYMNSDDPDDDTTKAAGPLRNGFKISKDVSDRCNSWYNQVQSRMDKQVTIDSEDSLEVPKSIYRQRNDECAVCEWTDIHSDSNDVCLGCGLALSTSSKIFSALAKNEICDFGVEDYEEPAILKMDFSALAERDSNSKLLYQLWHDEDFTQTLLQRDKDWDERREKLLYKTNYGSSVLGSSVFDRSSVGTRGKAMTHRSRSSRRSRSSCPSSRKRMRTTRSSPFNKSHGVSAKSTTASNASLVSFFNNPLPNIADVPASSQAFNEGATVTSSQSVRQKKKKKVTGF